VSLSTAITISPGEPGGNFYNYFEEKYFFLKFWKSLELILMILYTKKHIYNYNFDDFKQKIHKQLYVGGISTITLNKII
jgi:hypothetical protein